MTRQTRTMESLPPEVLLNIFSKLPVTSLQNVKLVCRQWHKLARDPFLINLLCSHMIENDRCLILHCDYPVTSQLYAVHLYRHDENIGMVKHIQVPIMPEFDVIGSCNGLLCFSNHTDRNVFYVYNPAVNSYVELPQATQYADNWTAFGFGFSPSTKEYKLVKIAQNRSQARHRYLGIMPPSAVEILTLGSSNWRNLEQTSYFPIASSSQVLVNGRLHWTNWPRRYHRGRALVSFNLENEQFQEVPKPDSSDLERQHYELLVLGGCLAAAYYSSSTKLQIWVMKDYGVKQSWINELNIENHIPRGLEREIDRSFRTSKFYSRRYRVRVLCRLKNGEILLSYMCRALVAYDPASRTLSDVQIHGMPNWFEAIVHMSSLNWIDNLAESCKSSKIAVIDRSVSIMDRLPYEIALNILSRLPITSLLKAKLVSRAWKNLVQDPVLACLHFSRMSQKDPSLLLHCNFPLPTKLYFVHNSDLIENREGLKRIILPGIPNFFNVAGSCRGLICFYDLLHKNAMYLFNPFTRNYLELPKAEKLTKYDDVSFGFGFLPTTKEYKVVRIVYHSISKSDVQIFNLGRSSWRNVGPIAYKLQRKPSHALVNRRLHWLTLAIEQEPLQIVSFDLADEQFRIVPGPNCIFFHKHCSHLVILKGSLSMAAFSTESQLDIWIMKEYDVKESWTKSFSIGDRYLLKELIQHEVQSFSISETFIDLTYIRMLCMMGNGEILLSYRGKALLLYDPSSCILDKLMLPGLPNFFQPIVHICSLSCIDSISHV